MFFFDQQHQFIHRLLKYWYLLAIWRFFSNHQLSTAYQTFLVTKGFQYSCHWPCISNNVFTYQNNVTILKVSFCPIPLLSILQCCTNFFSPAAQNSSDRCWAHLHCFWRNRSSFWKIHVGGMITLGFIVTSCIGLNEGSYLHHQWIRMLLT